MDEKAIELLRIASSDSFVIFCYYYDFDFFKSRPFLKDIAIAFQDIADGKMKRLSVSLPPRAGKSYITTLYCAWLLGKNPKESVMRNTCTATLSRKLSRDARDVVISEKFSKVFPNVKLSADNSAVDGWSLNTSRNVGYFGQGVGGTIIGFGASLVAITDDLFRSMEDAMSETIRDKTHSWKQGTHDSRRESGCSEIDIGTRWVRDDVIGLNSSTGYYDKEIIVPALTEEGNSFCEAVMTTDEYIDKKKKISKEIWMAEYMQQPIDVEGRLFEDLKTFTHSELELILKNNEGVVSYVDVADEGKDFYCAVFGAIKNGLIYIIDVIYSQENTDITKHRTVKMLEKYKSKYCQIETNSMGAMLTRQIRELAKDVTIIGINSNSNKITRIFLNSAIILDKFRFLDAEIGTEYYHYLENMKNYSHTGKNKNDDAPDSTTGLALFIQVQMSHLLK